MAVTNADHTTIFSAGLRLPMLTIGVDMTGPLKLDLQVMRMNLKLPERLQNR